MTAPALRIEPRTVEILARVKAVFAAKGFDGASMQDLARGAGMSAGNFYRYFPSKNAIVEAMVAQDLERVEADFAKIMQAPSPLAALRATLAERMQTMADEDGPLWAEIQAAAARRVEIAQISARMEVAVIAHLLRVFAAIARLPEDEARQRFHAHAELLVMLFKGASMTCGEPATGKRPSAELNALVLRLMYDLLDEIAAAGGTRTGE